MNTFAYIEKLQDFAFRKVQYYSIRLEGSETTEFEDFLIKMESEPDYEEDVINLFTWLGRIGKYEGAKEKYFRHEGSISDAKALPPRVSIMEAQELMVHDIRLYCQRLNEHVVVFSMEELKQNKKPRIVLTFQFISDKQILLRNK